MHPVQYQRFVCFIYSAAYLLADSRVIQFIILKTESALVLMVLHYHYLVS